MLSSTYTDTLSTPSLIYDQSTSVPIHPMMISSLLPEIIYFITGKLKLLKIHVFQVPSIHFPLKTFSEAKDEYSAAHCSVVSDSATHGL